MIQWRRKWVAVGVSCVVLAVTFFILPCANEPAEAGGNSKGESIFVHRLHGSAAIWNETHKAWRQIFPGDSFENAQTLRVSSDGAAEISLGRSRILLGRSSIAAISCADGKLQCTLNRGAARITANGKGVLIRTKFGEVESSDGESAALLNDSGLTVAVARGKARVGNQKHELKSGSALEISAAGSQDTLFPQSAVEALTIPGDSDSDAPALGRLVVRDSSGREADALEVRELRVRARIDGAVALTEIEETFFNPGSTRAEGTFYFPIPAGASLSRFAMYVDGKLVEGELVERERAREVYESIVRKMQDPALMEWQEGNVFKTRIFPIPPNGPKRILISYTQLLPAVDGERRYVYPLVSKTTQAGAIGRFEFDAVISGNSGRPRVPGYADAGVTANTVQLKQKNFRPPQDLVLRVGAARAEPLELQTDRRLGEDGFFLLSYLPAAQAGSPGAANTPRDWLFLFDTSLSRRADDYKAQLKVLRTMLQELRAGDRFAVVSFDVAARIHQQQFDSGPDAEAKILAELEALIPLGATNIETAFDAASNFLEQHPPRGRAEIVCITDGTATLGELAPEKLATKIAQTAKQRNARIHSVIMGAEHDRLLLREISRRSGGLARVIIPGDEVENEAFKLALDLESPLLPAPKFAFDGGGVQAVFPKEPGTLVAGEELILAGRYTHPGALRVAVEHGASSLTAAFELPESDSRHVYIPRLWARERLESLLLETQTLNIAREVVDLSQEFTLITPYTSFLVLENEAEYSKYGLVRHKRRRYWEETGKLRTSPPPEEQSIVTPPLPPPPPPPPAVPEKPAEPQPEPGPEPFDFEGLDLSLLAQRRGDGRELSTALSALCQEIYYRYMQLSPDIAPVVDRAAIMASADPAEVFVGGSGVPSGNSAPATDNSPIERLRAANSQVTPIMPVRAAPPLPSTAGTASPGSGGGWGGRNGSGIDMGGGRGSFGYRSAGGRRLMVKRHGGSRATESSTDSAGSWLAQNQREDGHWGQGYEETSFCLLMFLGAGHTEKVGEFKSNVSKGVEWLIARQDQDGKVSGDLYEQALATLALSEAAGMANKGGTKNAAQAAINYLCAQQDKTGGGWNYRDGKSHPLVSVFAIAALKSAKVAGLHVPHETFDGAIKYLDSISTEIGRVGLRGKPEGKEVHLLHTAAVALGRQFLGYRGADMQLLSVADLLFIYSSQQRPMEPDGLFLRYFGTLAMFQQGGERWKQWNDWLKPRLVESQRKDGKFAGSWDPEGIYVLNRVGARTENDPAAVAQLPAAVAAAAAAPREWKTYETLTDLLARCADIESLREVLRNNAGAPPEARSLMQLRLGLLLMQQKNFAEAVIEFRAVYAQTKEAGNVLPFLVNGLHQAGDGLAALELLIKEENLGRASDWRRQTCAALLLDPTSRIDNPFEFLSSRLNGVGTRHTALKSVCAQAAFMAGKFDSAAALFAELYQENERAECYVAPYLDALTSAKRAPEARRFLFDEARAGRLVSSRLSRFSQMLMDETNPLERVAAELPDHPEFRVLLYTQIAHLAAQANKHELRTAAQSRAYIEGGRPVSGVQSYVQALTASKQFADAARELERIIQGGYHTTWTFQTLAECYRETQRADVELLRAVSSETEIFARDVQPHINLAQFFERSGNKSEALRQYQVAVQLKPEDPYFYRQLLERAIANGSNDIAFETLAAMSKRFATQASVWGPNDADLLKQLQELNKDSRNTDLANKVREFLVKDLVVTINWDTATDIDLHIVDPAGEECFYSHKQTKSGGALDHDDTDGFGPETFAIRRGPPGNYQISVDYFNGVPSTVVTIQIFRHRNGSNETAVTKTVQLRHAKERVWVETVTLP